MRVEMSKVAKMMWDPFMSEEEFNEKLNEIGLYVTDVNIINFDFSQEFNSAIEAKQIACALALFGLYALIAGRVPAFSTKGAILAAKISLTA